ncbi:MAG: response regulator transcription factor [Acidaminococcaceae bacterium]|nr:response regulator transcription factor [Acidaminococcaceae bacterium]
MSKILIADDNEQIATLLAKFCVKEGLEPVLASDGEMVLKQFAAHVNDIAMVLLDVMMPKLDGFQVCKLLRKDSMVPIIMITARDEDCDRIMGLDMGADDYVVKPFSPTEVMARIRAVLRRSKSLETAAGGIVTISNLFIDLNKYEVRIGPERIRLTNREIELLYTLANTPVRMFSRDELLSLVWGDDYEGADRVVDTHVKRLRAKLEQVPHPGWEVRTVWGKGYKFEVL